MRRAVGFVSLLFLLSGCTLFSDPVIEACEEFDVLVGYTRDQMDAARATPDEEASTEEWQESQRIMLTALLGAKSDALLDLSKAVSESGKGTSSLFDLSLSGAASWKEMASRLSIENQSDWDLIQQATFEETMVLEECKDYGATMENAT